MYGMIIQNAKIQTIVVDVIVYSTYTTCLCGSCIFYYFQNKLYLCNFLSVLHVASVFFASFCLVIFSYWLSGMKYLIKYLV